MPRASTYLPRLPEDPLHAHSIAFDTERDPRASCAISDGLPCAFPSLVDVAVLSNLSDSLSDSRREELYPPKACLLDRLNARPSNVVSCLNLALWQLAVDGIRVSANLIILRASGSFRPRPHEWNAPLRAFSILQRRRRRRF